MKLLVLTTGGTFGSSETNKGLSAKEVYYKDQLYSLAVKYTNFDVSFTHASSFIKLSENIVPSDWVLIGSIINNNINDVDAVLILHGTDTMAYTTSALSYFEPISKKIPIVLTGSNYPFNKENTDAIVNYVQSIIALKYFMDNGVHGVFIVFNGNTSFSNDARIHVGAKAKKEICEGYCYKTFYCPNGYIGTVKGISNVEFNHDYYNQIYPNKCVFSDLVYDFSPKSVFGLKIYPGMPTGIIRSLVDYGVKSIVIELYNSGTGPVENVDFSLLEEIKFAHNKGINIFAVSQQDGNLGASMNIYETSYMLKDVGAIPLRDLIWESAMPKLMIAHSNFKANEDIINYATTNIAGEIS